MQERGIWWQRPTILVAAGIFGVALLLLWPYLAYSRARPADTGTSVTEVPALPVASYNLSDPPPAVTTVTPEPTAGRATAIVYISGAVVQPDVYRVPGDARVKDVVVAAGGLAADAAVTRINLAAHIEDAQHIHIPSIYESPTPDPGVPDAPGGVATRAGGLIDINLASPADFEELPGIGATLAQRIVDYRTANGPFATVEDLRNVRGIGPTLFAEIADLVTTGQ